MIQPKPYPWHSIDRVPRAVLGLARAAHAALRGHADPSRLAAAASQILGEPVKLLIHGVRPLCRDARPRPGALALLASHDASRQALLTVEPALAARITSTLLGRPTPWVDAAGPVPPPIQGAVAALLAAVARRASSHPLQLLAVGDPARRAFEPDRSGLVVEATALLGDEAFSVCAELALCLVPTSGESPFDLATLRALGDAPLTLQVVAACSRAPAHALTALEPGDAWLPGDGWTVHRANRGLAGTLLLMTPLGELALPANLHADGQIVLGKGVMQADVDVKTTQRDDVSDGPEQADVADVIADVPVVVRVELGAVTLTARQWAALQPGDVLMTGTRIAERALLRIGGVEVAQGELVDVDGELGVRISARVSRGGEP